MRLRDREAGEGELLREMVMERGPRRRETCVERVVARVVAREPPWAVLVAEAGSSRSWEGSSRSSSRRMASRASACRSDSPQAPTATGGCAVPSAAAESERSRKRILGEVALQLLG